MLPCPEITNGANGRMGNAVHFPYRNDAHAVKAKEPYFYNILSPKFGFVMAFTMPLKALSYGKVLVFRRCNPAKVINRIIRLVKVDVVNLGEAFRVFYKRLCDKSMTEWFPILLPTNRERVRQIAQFRFIGFQDFNPASNSPKVAEVANLEHAGVSRVVNIFPFFFTHLKECNELLRAVKV